MMEIRSFDPKYKSFGMNLAESRAASFSITGCRAPATRNSPSENRGRV